MNSPLPVGPQRRRDSPRSPPLPQDDATARVNKLGPSPSCLQSAETPDSDSRRSLPSAAHNSGMALASILRREISETNPTPARSTPASSRARSQRSILAAPLPHGTATPCLPD